MSDTEHSKLNNKDSYSWAVIGATGFVGSGIIQALSALPTEKVRPIKAPRLEGDALLDEYSTLESLLSQSDVKKAIKYLTDTLTGSDIVVNAAGIAAPDATESDALYGANALLPSVIAEAAKQAGVRRYIHISSVAVQGNRQILDESYAVKPFSAYSQSKAVGEQTLVRWTQKNTRDEATQIQVVIIRATSVQGAARPTTRRLEQVAKSRIASVAKPGDQPSVVSSLAGLSDFVVTIGQHDEAPPQVLIQPWEGASVRDVIQVAGNGRNPVMIPNLVARIGVNVLKACGWIYPGFRGLSRRLEVMWFGQEQVPGWAVDVGLVKASANGPSKTLRNVFD